MASQSPFLENPDRAQEDQDLLAEAAASVDSADVPQEGKAAFPSDGSPEATPSAEGMQESLQGQLLESEVVRPRRRGMTLSRRLLLTLMPTTLIPLVIAGYLGFRAEKQQAREQALSLLREESFLAAKAASDFVEDGFRISSALSASPEIQRLVKESESLVEEAGLVGQEISELENAYSETKLLNPSPEVNRYLQRVTEAEALGEVFLTERNGFNVAYSNPTSDFVQRDERWWTASEAEGFHIGAPEFDRSSQSFGLALSVAIQDSESGDFLGVIKTQLPTEVMDERIESSISSSTVGASQAVQIVDARTGLPFNLIETRGASTNENSSIENASIIGGSAIAALAIALQEEFIATDKSLAERQAAVIEATNIPDIRLSLIDTPDGEEMLVAEANIDTKRYSLTTVPGTNWLAIASVDISEVESAGDEVLRVFATTTVLLSLAAAAVLLLLARQLAAPLQSLTTTAEAATAGNLDIRADLQGTVETQTLGQVFNTLLNQIQTLLKQQRQTAEEQQRLREDLEEDINRLMEEIGDAADGDLRVRAKLSEGDVGIVADLFNAIIENLRITAIQVKASTGEVTQSLQVNEAAIRELAQEAIAEANSLKETMVAVEDISTSIQEVADNASQASRLTEDTYTTVQAGTSSMDQTVTSILGLRSTVGETAKKIKRLGESAQKISQVVSLIDEIALKTNLLAVNASVEAARAGEMGQGFTAVAEQVGSLAEQSSTATREIAKIVASIQTETQEVVASIETGTAQVVDSTTQVENTKQRLAEVLLKSERINELMQKISAAAVSQSETSAAVTKIVKQATQDSEKQAESSGKMAQAIQSTAQVARALESSVEQFKIDDRDSEPGSETALDPEPLMPPQPEQPEPPVLPEQAEPPVLPEQPELQQSEPPEQFGLEPDVW